MDAGFLKVFVGDSFCSECIVLVSQRANARYIESTFLCVATKLFGDTFMFQLTFVEDSKQIFDTNHLRTVIGHFCAALVCNMLGTYFACEQ